MAKVKIGLTGDLHEDFRSLESIVKTAVAHGVQVLDIPGDLIDGPFGNKHLPGTFDGDVLKEWYKRLGSKGVDIKTYNTFTQVVDLIESGKLDKLPEEQRTIAEEILRKMEGKITEEDIDYMKKYMHTLAEATYQQYIPFLKKAKEAGIKIVGIAGNHD